MIKILKGNVIFTKSPNKFTVIENGYIVVNNTKVIDVYEKLPEEYKDVNIENHENKLIIPGMIDLHCHAPQFRNLGMSMDKELLPWLNNTTFPEESKYKNLDYATNMYKKFIQNIWKNGTTRIVAFATIHKDSSMKLIDLFRSSGLGAYVGKVNMDRNCCDDLVEDTKTSLSDTEEILNKYKDSALVKPIITPRFIPCCSDELLKGLGELCLKYNVKSQSHMSENLSEIDWVKDLHPDTQFYGDAYNKFSLFGQTPTLMAHCVHSSYEEIQLMRKNNVIAVHCPDSNLNLASGIMPIRNFLDYGIQVGFGSDISGGHSLSIFRTIVSAIQLSKLSWINSSKESTFLSLAEAFYIATKSGGSFFGKVGSFEKDYEFDALIIDDDNLNFDNYSLLQRLERFIYLGDDRNIIHRYVRGTLIEEPTWN